MNLQKINQIRHLIERARTKQALQELIAFSREENLTEYVDACLNLVNQLSKLERKNMMGIISSNEYSTESNKITYQTILLIREIETSSKISEIEQKDITEIEEISHKKERNISFKLKNIAWLEKGLHCASSVCLVMVRKESNFGDTFVETGTGFLVNTNLGLAVITNHHVVKNEKELAKTTLVFGYQVNRLGNLENRFEYKADPSKFETDKTLDYSIFKVLETNANKPKMEKWGSLELVDEIRIDDIKKGEHVTIIQHPNGQLKQIALNENRITEKKGNDIFYLTDTDHGSSGSPVFNDDWEVIALHWGHRLVKTKKEKDYYNNGGTLIQKIKEDLKDKSINLL